MAYDEGLLSNDIVLSSALWRCLFAKDCKDPKNIELCVNYIRKQVCFYWCLFIWYLNRIDFDILIIIEYISFVLIHSDYKCSRSWVIYYQTCKQSRISI